MSTNPESGKTNELLSGQVGADRDRRAAYQSHEEYFGSDGHDQYFEVGDSFTGIHTCQNLSKRTL